MQRQQNRWGTIGVTLNRKTEMAKGAISQARDGVGKFSHSEQNY